MFRQSMIAQDPWFCISLHIDFHIVLNPTYFDLMIAQVDPKKEKAITMTTMTSEDAETTFGDVSYLINDYATFFFRHCPVIRRKI